jgi:hypothetical protein
MHTETDRQTDNTNKENTRNDEDGNPNAASPRVAREQHTTNFCSLFIHSFFSFFHPLP